jgi:hypothetical protein
MLIAIVELSHELGCFDGFLDGFADIGMRASVS